MSAFQRIQAEAPRPPRRVRVRAFAFESRVPPAEIQLWNLGDNSTDYGVHKWTARSADDVLARYESRGNPLLVDVEHNGATTEGDEPTATGGYARLELRAGAPWLVFEWSAFAVEQIASGQRRYLSPEYDVDRTTGEITALYRVSLVADPGTHCARVLAASITQETGMDPKLAAIMAILTSVADPAAAIEAIKSLVATLDGGEAPAESGADDAGPPAVAASDGGQDPAAGDDDKKDKVATASDDGEKPIAAAAAPPASPAAKPVAPPQPAVLASVERVTAAAVLQIEIAQRDHLLATSGDRLDPAIRRWATSQPLAVVRGLLEAAPAKHDAPSRVTATRGATHGQNAEPQGLQGAELEELQKGMGTFKAAAPEPHTTPGGKLVLPSVPPRLHRERLRVAASAAAASAAGKAGT